MSRRGKKLRKKKRREERLRQEKHLRHSHYQPRYAADEQPDYADDGPDSSEHAGEAALPSVAPSSFMVERSLRGLAKAAAGKDFANIEEYNAHMGPYWNDLSRGRALLAADPKEQAQDLAFQAMEAADEIEAQKLARQALELDPDCVDALVTLAQFAAKSPAEKIAQLGKAVEAGARALGGEEYFEQNKGHLWGAVHTRPYMRARADLAQMLMCEHHTDEATRHFEALLDLNPGDNQGNRYLLLGCYLEAGQLESARRLFAQFKGESLAVFNWGRVLERFLSGDRRGAVEALAKARQQNKHVEPLLLGQREEVNYSGSFVPGQESEADQVLVCQFFAWAKHLEALEWLRDGGCMASAEQRQASLAAYTPPVADLLTMGRPANDWADYRKLGLTEEHIPQLAKMAVDDGLYEAETDAAYFARVHAWRALGQFGGDEAAQALTAALDYAGDGDDWALNDLPDAFALVGAAALPCLGAYLGREKPESSGCNTAAESLGQLGVKHPELRDQCVKLLVEQLLLYESNDRTLNGFLMNSLLDLKAREAIPAITEAFEAEAVDETIAGGLEDVKRELLRGA